MTKLSQTLRSGGRMTGLFLSLLASVVFTSPFFFVIATRFGLMMLLEYFTKVKYSMIVEWFILIFLVMSNYLGADQGLGFYDSISWWDEMLHFMYGFVFSFIGYRIIKTYLNFNDLKSYTWLIISYAFFFSVSIGALWEIYEYKMDQMLVEQYTIKGITLMQADKGSGEDQITDTMEDIILETKSALLFCFILYFYLTKNKYGWLVDIPLIRGSSSGKK